MKTDGVYLNGTLISQDSLGSGWSGVCGLGIQVVFADSREAILLNPILALPLESENVLTKLISKRAFIH